MLCNVLFISASIALVGSQQNPHPKKVCQWVDEEIQRVDKDIKEISSKADGNSQLISELEKELNATDTKRKEDLDGITANLKNQLEYIRHELVDETESRIQDVQAEFADKLHEIKQGVDENERNLNQLVENVDTTLGDYDNDISELHTFRESIEETLDNFNDAQKNISPILPFLNGDTGLSILKYTCMRKSIPRMKNTGADNLEEKIEIMLNFIKREVMCKNDVKGVIREATDLVTSSTLSIENVTTMAELYADQGRYMDAIVLYYIRGKMTNLIGNKGVRIPQISVEFIRLVVKTMTSQGRDVESIVRTIAIPVMTALIDDIRTVKFADPEYKVEFQAWGYRDISLVYSYIYDNEEFSNMNKIVINFLKDELKENAPKFRVLGVVLNNAGAAYVGMGNLTMAMKVYAEAMEVYATVTDWPNDMVKETSIILTGKNIETISKLLNPDPVDI